MHLNKVTVMQRKYVNIPYTKQNYYTLRQEITKELIECIIECVDVQIDVAETEWNIEK